MTRNEIIERLVEWFELDYPDKDEDGNYIMDGYDWTAGCGINGRWLSLKEIVFCLED